MTSPLELRHGFALPTDIFPIFENAIRARAGRGVVEHQAVLGRMMARFSAVAARNPYAWFPVERSPDEFTAVSASNRWICFPYPKLMNAIIAVDLAAALVLMSEAEAERRGVPANRRVAFLAGANCLDPWTLTERQEFSRSPGLAAAARTALDHAGLDVRDVDLFDLYSCFPSAVELAMDALGLDADDPRPLTVTGGLPCAGGPGNSYCMHSVAAMVERLREGAGKVGYVSGLGMAAAKHAVGILSTDPARIAAADGEAPSIQLPAEDLSGPVIADAPEGPATIETYTVAFDRENTPRTSRLIVRLEDGRRTVAHGEEAPSAFARLLESEGIGLRGRVRPGRDGEPNRFEL
jgi:acetyl-CoA C-acetyltransferase